jgi:hypothetical protein
MAGFCFCVFAMVGCGVKNQESLKSTISEAVLAPKIDKIEDSERVDLTPIKEDNIVNKTIVIVLPNSKEADQILNGATLALKNSGLKEVALVFMQAGKLAECKLKVANAILIGFAADKIPEAINVAEENDIPLISLSKCAGKNCAGVYALRDRVEEEVFFVCGHAISKGLTNLAILAPGGQYSDNFMTEIAQQASINGKSDLKFEIINYNNPANLGKLREFNGQAVVVIAKGAKLINILDYLNRETINLGRWQIFGLSHWFLEPTARLHPTLSNAQCCSINLQKYSNFRDEYCKHFNKEPGDVAVTAFDVISFLIKESKEGSVLNQEYDGIDGIYNFSCNKKGEAVAQRTRRTVPLASQEDLSDELPSI